MSDHYTPNYSESLDAITGRLERIADDMDECATLRDRFAMAALQGLLAGESPEVGMFTSDDEKTGVQKVAESAYAHADAMLVTRKPKTEQT